MFLSLVLISAVVAVPGERANPFRPISISRKQVSRGEWPQDLPDSLAKQVREFQPLAAALELSATVSHDPPSVLFLKEGDKDAPWMLGLTLHTQKAFRHKFQVEERNFVPLTVIHLDNQDSYESLLDLLDKAYPFLGSWIQEAKSINGFALYAPRLVVVVENRLVHRTINRDNNLVHLVGHAVLHQYFDVQPFWVREGVALDLEVTTLDKLYALCSGDAQAPIKSPGKWRKEIKRSFRRRSAVNLDGLAALDQGIFDRREILRSLGAVRYLLSERLDDFKDFLDAVSIDRRAHLSSDPYYLPDEMTQVDLLSKALGNDEWTAEAIRGLAKGDTKKTISSAHEWRVGRKRRSAWR